MRTPFYMIVLAYAAFLACGTRSDYPASRANTSNSDPQLSSTEMKLDTGKGNETNSADLKPIWGYRFSVTGDFDGNGQKEVLEERYCSGFSGKEINKYFIGDLEYGDFVDLTVSRDPVSCVLPVGLSMDTLHISSGGQLLGLSMLKNEGDLDDDGGDELSYVINWADHSAVNTWHLVTNKHGRWFELYSFAIRDWQLPDLPGVHNQFGFFGLEDKVVKNYFDNLDIQKDYELWKYPGLIKKISPSQIQVIRINDEVELDTLTIDLRGKIPGLIAEKHRNE